MSEEPQTPEADEGTVLAQKLELLAAVAQATVGAILKVVDEKRGGVLTPEIEPKVEALRGQLRAAVATLGDYQERHGGDAVDLDALEGRLRSILQTLDQRLPDPETPPS